MLVLGNVPAAQDKEAILLLLLERGEGWPSPAVRTLC